MDRIGEGVAPEPMLIRPDGYVCWAGNTDDLDSALTDWFGRPRS